MHHMNTVVIWLKYCRYGVKHYPINQSKSKSKNKRKKGNLYPYVHARTSQWWLYGNIINSINMLMWTTEKAAYSYCNTLLHSFESGSIGDHWIPPSIPTELMFPSRFWVKTFYIIKLTILNQQNKMKWKFNQHHKTLFLTYDTLVNYRL